MKSVVVCGSKKYKDEILEFCSELEKLGVLVFEPSIKYPIPENKTFSSEYVTNIVFKGLTLEHFDWIRKSDVCFIFNKKDYVGVSTTMEMAYASALGKPIFALSGKTGDPCRDSLIDKIVKTPQKLASLL
jgi:nucleoside 2-deoxyribosyltransferase